MDKSNAALTCLQRPWNQPPPNNVEAQEHLAELEGQFGTDKAIRDSGIACYPEMKKARPKIQPIVDQFGDMLMTLAQSKLAARNSGVRKRK